MLEKFLRLRLVMSNKSHISPFLEFITDVDVFFAAGGVRHLEPGQFEKMAKHSDVDPNLLKGIMDKLLEGARLHCSFGSVASVLGKKEGEGALIVPDEKISWEGPSQVIELSAAADTVLIY